MEGNASVYQVYPVSRITGEARAEFLRTWGAGFEQEGAVYTDILGTRSQPDQNLTYALN